ncbi:hypothetical protein A6F68_02168 [Tsuneonella dongtanensis]|uniref:Uncharacterized protein n=1 Tax=Tsuneonella dongtanensis TaxID=692370 RepID=A0A1B2AEU7_9SPHN|nr:hypothetical protein [Tsuneonella dongtanensis]ANY20669.1 hypothetical protein A6F68_02168 [Tsuneonella dongtanensis]
MKRTPALLAAAALAALIPAQAQAQAQAAKACLTEREVAQMAIYAVPSVVTGVRGKCAPRLSKSGFLATKGDTFAQKYAALQVETWPVAKSALLKFVGGSVGKPKADDPIAMFASLPDESVRPLVDAMIAQKIGEAVKPEQCGNVERGMQLASVLSPRDSGAMIAFIMAMTKPKNPPICPAAS